MNLLYFDLFILDRKSYCIINDYVISINKNNAASRKGNLVALI